jgi:predicted DNA-binding ribbon-helix-helix protein
MTSTTSAMTRRNFYLPERIWEKLQEVAKARQVSISEVIRQILEDGLSRGH